MSGGADRRAELTGRLSVVRGRIADAAGACAAPVPELIVVTKYFPAADVAILASLGVRAVGENRDQEAAAKALDLQDLGLHWHFIGQLQTNKAKSVVRYAHTIQSVDRPALVTALHKGMLNEQQRLAGAGLPPRTPLRCLIQVDLDQRPPGDRPAGGARGGAAPEQVAELARLIEDSDQLCLDGLMAVAPLGADPAEAFTRLAGYSRRLQEDYPHAGAVSAGMSGDLEQAVAAGATHLRVGSDVLGPRPPLR